MFMDCPARLLRDERVRLPDRLVFVASSFKAFVCSLCPELFQHPADCCVSDPNSARDSLSKKPETEACNVIVMYRGFFVFLREKLGLNRSG